MSKKEFKFGLSDTQLWEQKLIYASDLFSSQRILVTGGGSGIGKATAWMFARLGATVIISGRDEDKLSEAQEAMSARGLSVQTSCFNIRDSDQVTERVKEIFANGGLNTLVNNAGGQFPQPAIDFSPKGWKAVIDTNLNGTWFMMQAAAKQWRESNDAGNIINMVAVVDKGMPDVAHTCAARAGVIHASKTVSVEWAPYDIRVNCIAPGVIDSEGMRVYSDKARERFYLANPMKRPGSIWDIAQACGYLASDAASFINGEVLTIDGGGRNWGELWTYEKPDYFNE